MDSPWSGRCGMMDSPWSGRCIMNIWPMAGRVACIISSCLSIIFPAKCIKQLLAFCNSRLNLTLKKTSPYIVVRTREYKLYSAADPDPWSRFGHRLISLQMFFKIKNTFFNYEILHFIWSGMEWKILLQKKSKLYGDVE